MGHQALRRRDGGDDLRLRGFCAVGVRDHAGLVHSAADWSEPAPWGGAYQQTGVDPHLAPSAREPIMDSCPERQSILQSTAGAVGLGGIEHSHCGVLFRKRPQCQSDIRSGPRHFQLQHRKSMASAEP